LFKQPKGLAVCESQAASPSVVCSICVIETKQQSHHFSPVVKMNSIVSN